jgi:glycosyltransferase involved in cell wall biosynthesis
LPGLLACLLAQTYPAERLEVFLVDGGSDDDTPAQIDAAVAVHPHFHRLDNPRQLPAAALNLALAQARGEVFLRLDARTRPAPDYIARCVAALQRGPWAGVAGPQTAVGETPAAQTHALALNHPLGTGAATYRRATRPTASETLYLGAYWTEWLRRVGGWDESLAATEDYELNLRVRHQGGHLLVDPSIRSTYLARETLAELAGQYYRNGAWRTVIRRRHREAMRGRHLIPALFFPALVMALLATPVTPWPLLGIGGAYAALVVAVSVALGRCHGWRHVPRLLLTFPTLHLAYGVGFWSGLVCPPRAV